jgi:hypothetical protein
MHGASFLNRAARNSCCTVITDPDTSIRSTQKAFFTPNKAKYRVIHKIGSISHVYISLNTHGIWMTYIIFERGGPKFSNTTARAQSTALQQRQLRSKWLVGSTSFCLYTDSLFAQIGGFNEKCSSSFEVECWNEDETYAVQQSPTQF